VDWENERYVRVYVRDSADDMILSWQARALWSELLRKFDRSGVLDMGKHGLRALSALVRMPADVVTDAAAELVADGRIEISESGRVVAPNFMNAQEAKQSDKMRQAESRARRREVSRNVTECHDVSQPVTDGHTVSHGVTPSLAEPTVAKPSLAKPSLAVKGARKRAHAIEETWQPSSKHQDLATELGVDIATERDRFVDHFTASGGTKKDWSAAFRNWLRRSKEWGSGKTSQGGSKSGGLSFADLAKMADEAGQE